jgi:hypothetical protein
MRLASLLLLALVAIALVACKTASEAPANTAGDAAEIEQVFDQGFPDDETTTYSDDFDSLDSDLAMS